MGAASLAIVVALATGGAGQEVRHAGRSVVVFHVGRIEHRASVGVLPGVDADGFLREVGRQLFPALAKAGKRVHVQRSGDAAIDAIFDLAPPSGSMPEVWVTAEDVRARGWDMVPYDLNIFIDDAGHVGVITSYTPEPGGLVGVARRPGIVTPGDIVSTLLDRLGVEPKGLSGVPLREHDSRFEGNALRARLERDRHYGPGLAWVAVLAGFGVIVAAAFAARRGLRDVARRATLASALVPAGFVAGTFVPSGSWWMRALPIGAALIVGAALKPVPDRAIGWVGLSTAVAICALAVAATLRPGGEPALSLWGNPLTSWRLFGLRNMFVAFVTGGILLAAGARILRGRWPAIVGVTAAIVVGAPTIGANFAGVLTLVVAVALAMVLHHATRLRVIHLLIAGGAGVLAMGVALASDSGSPVSHGGRAVERVSEGGLRALTDILGSRWRLNVAEVTDLGLPGYLGVAIVIAALVALTVWGARNLPGPLPNAVLGGAVAALVAIVIEDSGFFTGGIISMFPAIVWLLAATATNDPPGEPVEAQPA